MIELGPPQWRLFDEFSLSSTEASSLSRLEGSSVVSPLKRVLLDAGSSSIASKFATEDFLQFAAPLQKKQNLIN
jgi:hypothetical protein